MLILLNKPPSPKNTALPPTLPPIVPNDNRLPTLALPVVVIVLDPKLAKNVATLLFPYDTAAGANTPLPYNTLLVLPSKLIDAILPAPDTLPSATANAVLATLALGTKPDTLAPAMPDSACPLPIILPTLTLPVVVIVLDP